MAKNQSNSSSSGSIEIEQPSSRGDATYGVDIVFGLDIKKISVSETGFADQLLLVAKNVVPRVGGSGVTVNSLIDLGVLTFTTHDPDLDDNVICCERNHQDYWASTEQLRRIWDALIKELAQFDSTWLRTPHVFKERHIRYAVTGMKYFNAFRSPNIAKMPFIYLSHETDMEAEDPQAKPRPLVLFEQSGF
jgi:hypothetical protein